MKLTVDIIEEQGLKLFLYDNQTFNVIQGIIELEGTGSLAIARENKLFDKTEYIGPCGAHDEGTAFRGLKLLALETNLPNGTGAAYLLPTHFKVKDQIIIETPINLSDDNLYGHQGLFQNDDPDSPLFFFF
jgi:hypothetical protein